MAIPTISLQKATIILLACSLLVSNVAGKLYVSMFCRIRAAPHMAGSLLSIPGHGSRRRDNLDCRTEPDNLMEGR